MAATAPEAEATTAAASCRTRSPSYDYDGAHDRAVLAVHATERAVTGFDGFRRVWTGVDGFGRVWTSCDGRTACARDRGSLSLGDVKQERQGNRLEETRVLCDNRRMTQVPAKYVTCARNNALWRRADFLLSQAQRTAYDKQHVIQSSYLSYPKINWFCSQLFARQSVSPPTRFCCKYS